MWGNSDGKFFKDFQWTPRTRILKNMISQHIIIKSFKASGKKTILKIGREKKDTSGTH